MFQDKEIIVVMNGAFATKKLLRWALNNQIAVKARMHSNRKIQFKEKNIATHDIKKFIPKGDHFVRTISLSWHGISLDITNCRPLLISMETSQFYIKLLSINYFVTAFQSGPMLVETTNGILQSTTDSSTCLITAAALS